jgi:hypothetical protein
MPCVITGQYLPQFTVAAPFAFGTVCSFSCWLAGGR